MPDRVLVEVTIAAPAAEVWDAIRNPDKVWNWFGWEAPSLKEEIDFIFFAEHAKADNEARILRFEGMPDRFEVIDAGGSAILRVVRAVADTDSWDGVYEDMTEGWISFVQQLKLAMDQHGLAPRRTLYFDGQAVPGGRAPIEALGLADLVDTPPGQPVNVTLPTGETIAGKAWHRTPWQFGLTVPQWGDGLLIVTDKSVTETAPDGRGMVILTTYGLSEAELGELEGRWKAWWDQRFVQSAAAACT